LFFDLGQTPALAKLRDAFLCNRRWPALEQSGLFDQIIREGVGKGHWRLFDMGGAERTKPERFYSRETGDVPLDANLTSLGWSLVTPAGARQRGWGSTARIEVSTVIPWVTAVIGEAGATTAGAIAAKVAEQHGEVPTNVTFQAIDRVVQNGGAMTYTGDPAQEQKPDRLFYRSAAMLHQVAAGDAVVATSEAAKRGWVQQAEAGYRLTGAEASACVLPILGQFGSLYNRGAKMTVGLLDLVGLEIEGGGRVRLSLENASPAAMKRLGELFEVLPSCTTPRRSRLPAGPAQLGVGRRSSLTPVRTTRYLIARRGLLRNGA
jgi:hypothetical protein